jgi:RHS repeat-associated protein
MQFTVNTANNRLGVPAGQTGTMSYDPAGNLITDTYTGAGGRAYDGENRMVTAWGGNNQQQTYTYNADGQRVRRKVDGVETWQTYGMDGELLAEYAANAAVTSPQKEYGYRNGQLLVTADAPAGPTADFIWVEDTLPAGAVPAGTNESWSWVGTNPSPYAGIQSHQSAIVTGFHQHYFSAATGTLTVNSTDKLICYVYLDPSNMPNEIMLQWLDSSPSWEHRAYWGADVIENTYSRLYMGALPTAGQWVRLEVSVSAMGLSGSTLTGIAFKMNNGKATWDRAGKNGPGATGVQWLVSDQLGTPRMIFDKTGSLANMKRHDYLPFGEELFAGQNGRTVQQGYTGDIVRQKFTQKERDNETGLDFFEARYYASAQGRFTSADDPKYSLAVDPQTWNLYEYVRNGPLTRTDPTGRNWFQFEGGWYWFEGKKHVFQDRSGHKQLVKSNFQYLLRFTKTGTNKLGAAVGYLELYKQDKQIAKSDVFSGGTDEHGKSLNSIPNGTFYVNLRAHDIADEKNDSSVREFLSNVVYERTSGGDSLSSLL